jgi:hypothetical protein
MADIRRPNINAPTTEGQLEQIKSYLFQLTNQLNFAIKSSESMSNVTVKDQDGNELSATASAEKTFFMVKDLIIKSADIVNAYYETINKRLSGQYVAKSDFGTFKQETNANFEATSTSITQNYESIQTIESDVANLNELRKDNCYIKTGWLDDNETIAGVEVGKVSEVDGVTQTAFAQFTTNRLVFFDESGRELGSFSDYRLNVNTIVVKVELQFEGGYILDPSNGLAFKWGG